MAGIYSFAASTPSHINPAHGYQVGTPLYDFLINAQKERQEKMKAIKFIHDTTQNESEDE